MKTIVFDILNNDNGSSQALAAAVQFAKENNNYKLKLFGDSTQIKDVQLPDNIEFVHSPNLLKKTENLRDVLRTNSSMLDAIKALSEPDHVAILSSGDSGSYLTMATLKIKRLNNISRPAFMPLIPKRKDGSFLLLDVGANLEVKANYLTEWAKLGSLFYSTMNNTQKPSVALMNIGTEDYKGLESHKEANLILKQNKNINYLGFIEPKDIFDKQKNIDVVVCDGYAGNMILKTMETSFLTMGRLIKEAILSTFVSKIGGLLIKKSIKKLGKKFDYRNVGAAYVIGLEKIVLKAHGGSDKKAFLGALNQIKIAIESNVIEKMKQELSEEANV
ncbi:phosphate acyltransferase PlsX [Mycoplasma phocoenae]|uniref:Phosphate acyltransferase n=1 Tax=Mycoplasma phocoenae TaxID=754517 RepID=A0A858U5B4_9MOLU|nr:phosphate acyltransferase PlsX [Mycoplasma phocoenae]QJG67241.1 phosphate acyltransferase PlsX [Mycoplasma phocoenae]